MYFKIVGEHFIYLVLYVDDMLLTGTNTKIIQEFKTQISFKFDMEHIGATISFLGWKLKQIRQIRNS